MSKQEAAVIEAAKQYVNWARKTGDYPHDEDGCLAHEALINAVDALEGPCP